MTVERPAVERRVSSADRMFQGDEAHYFGVGDSAVRCMEVALSAAGSSWAQVGSVLDLPCGHGRVLRAIRARLPSAAICACDVDTDGVQFCAETFGAAPLVSTPDPSQLTLPGPFDLIWCGSLLTHLPIEECGAFLDLFARNLAPGGLALVTLHGREVARRIGDGVQYGLGERAVTLLEPAQRNGFAFAEYEGQQRYGISLCTPQWAVERVVRTTGLRLVGYTEAGWDGHQDVLVCERS